MISCLYEPFKIWSEKGAVWLLSDPHFADEDAKKLDPDWIDATKHVEKINRAVSKNDTLVCLGDCGDYRYFQKIQCRRKVLLKGNHDDKGNLAYKRKVITQEYNICEFSRRELYNKLREENPDCNIIIREDIVNNERKYICEIDNCLFDEVYSGALFISDKILLSHEPVNGLPFCVNIHGHCHSRQYEYTDDLGCRHLNIASNVIGYEMRELKSLIKEGLYSGIDDIHK